MRLVKRERERDGVCSICLGMDSTNRWDSTLPTHHFILRAQKTTTQLNILDQRKKLTTFWSPEGTTRRVVTTGASVVWQMAHVDS